jgi:hypothetical protein
MQSPIEIRNTLLSKGIEVWSTKDNRGIVFKNGEFYREGKQIYKTWELAITETELIFYKNLMKL